MPGRAGSGVGRAPPEGDRMTAAARVRDRPRAGRVIRGSVLALLGPLRDTRSVFGRASASARSRLRFRGRLRNHCGSNLHSRPDPVSHCAPSGWRGSAPWGLAFAAPPSNERSAAKLHDVVGEPVGARVVFRPGLHLEVVFLRRPCLVPVCQPRIEVEL